MKNVFPRRSMGNVQIIPWGWKVCLSNAFNMVDDVTGNGEPTTIQNDIDMIQVESPSSTIILKAFFPTPQLGY